MALLKSEKISLGIPAPFFKLPSVDAKVYALDDFSKSPALVVLFICNHCPYVKAIEARVLQIQRDYAPLGVQFVAICSNDSTDYPDDSPASLLKTWQEKKYGFPYLIDETQQAAKAYGAVCTPDIFVFDQARKLSYHGQLDNHWQEPAKVTRQDLREALERVLNGNPPMPSQTPSLGCSIKWRAGSGR